MIYIIDEDIIQLRPYANELVILGFQVKQIDNADSAYHTLTEADDVELALIDIMLATGPSESSRYSRDESRDFIKTGILLIEDILNTKGTDFSKKMAIFSMGSQDWLVRDINKLAKEFGIPYFKKRDYPSPYQFGVDISALINH